MRGLSKVDRAIVVFALVLAIVMLVWCAKEEHSYREKAIITEVTEEEVVCVTNQGEAWSFYVSQEDALSVGDTIFLKLYDNYTTDFHDDVINSYEIVKES